MRVMLAIYLMILINTTNNKRIKKEANIQDAVIEEDERLGLYMCR